jgi:hypothetical protein
VPYSDQTGWLSQQEWDDHAVFCRAMGKPLPIAHEPGTPAPQPAKAKASTKQSAAEPAAGYFDRVTGKVRPYSSDYKEVRSLAANWMGGLMCSCATSKVRELRTGDIVSYVVPVENTDMLHYGKVLIADPQAAIVEIMEHLPDSSDRWTPAGIKHTVQYANIVERHSRFPTLNDGDFEDEGDESEYSEARVRASFKDYFCGPRK